MNDRVTPTIANQDLNPTYSKSQEFPSELTEDFFPCMSENAGFAQVVGERVFAGFGTFCSTFKGKKPSGKRALSLLVFCLAPPEHRPPALPGWHCSQSFDDCHSQSFPVLKDQGISHLQILFSSQFRIKATCKPLEVWGFY